MRRLLFATLTTLVLSSAPAWAGVKILSPAGGGLVIGNTVWVEIKTSDDENVHSTLDGAPTMLFWRPLGYGKNAYAALLEIPSPGLHTLELSCTCRGERGKTKTLSFESRLDGATAAADSLAHHFLAGHKVRKLGWSWGEGVFLYGLHRLSTTSPHHDEYVSAIKEYHSAWAGKGLPSVNKADAIPPALSALALMTHDGDYGAFKNALAAARYVKNADRNRLNALDHLGASFFSHFYPDSIWIDSLMMYAVFAAQWGRKFNDPELRAWAAEQPLIFASKLQDPVSGLFKHAWHIKRERTIPKNAAHWLRGNAWAAASMVEILDTLEPHERGWPELRDTLQLLVDGARAVRDMNGLWGTVMDDPENRGYQETSGSALLAYAIAHGARQGYLPAAYREEARETFTTLTAHLKRTDGGFSMGGISGHTNPSDASLYRLVPRVKDKDYGVGAYLLLATEMGE